MPSGPCKFGLVYLGLLHDIHNINQILIIQTKNKKALLLLKNKIVNILKVTLNTILAYEQGEEKRLGFHFHNVEA